MPLRATRQRTPVAPREGFRAVGRVERPRGLRGEIKVLPLTTFPERFDVGARLYAQGAPRTVEASSWIKGRVFLRLSGITTPEAAEVLRGTLLEVPDDDRPAFEEGEYYLDEIEGCAVHDLHGATIGTVVEVLQPGANDVLVVRRQGERDLLVPALRDVVRSVDLEARVIVIDPPPGLDPDAPPHDRAHDRAHDGAHDTKLDGPASVAAD